MTLSALCLLVLVSVLLSFLACGVRAPPCGPGNNWQDFSLQVNVVCNATGTYTCNWTGAGSNCLAYIGTNVVDLSYLVPYYPIIWLSVTWEDSGWNDQCRGDCNDIKHKIASFPRILASMFPDTLDKDQVWLVGFSAGVGGINRGTVDSSKGYDRSRYGSTSDLFAGAWYLGGCPGGGNYFGTTNELIGKWHVITINGETDVFAADGCTTSLVQWAIRNGCSKPNAAWCPVMASDPLFPGTQADGSDNAIQLDFGDCAGGDVQGYRFAGEGHVTSAKLNYNPKISFTDIAWAWSQGRSKRLATTPEATIVPVPQCSSINASYNAASVSPANGWIYSRSDSYPSGYNPMSYFKKTGDPFAFPDPTLVPLWIPNSPTPTIPPLVASVEMIGWRSMAPLPTADQTALLNQLATITGEPVSRFSIGIMVNMGSRVSTVVLISEASSGKTGAQIVSTLASSATLTSLSGASIPVDSIRVVGSSSATVASKPITTNPSSTKPSTTTGGSSSGALILVSSTRVLFLLLLSSALSCYY